jgi:hypothetical protein
MSEIRDILEYIERNEITEKLRTLFESNRYPLAEIGILGHTYKNVVIIELKIINGKT